MEMVDEKGLDPEAADKIGDYVRYRGDSFTMHSFSSFTCCQNWRLCWYQGGDFDMHSPSLFTYCFVFPAYVTELHV